MLPSVCYTSRGRSWYWHRVQLPLKVSFNLSSARTVLWNSKQTQSTHISVCICKLYQYLVSWWPEQLNSAPTSRASSGLGSKHTYVFVLSAYDGRRALCLEDKQLSNTRPMDHDDKLRLSVCLSVLNVILFLYSFFLFASSRQSKFSSSAEQPWRWRYLNPSKHPELIAQRLCHISEDVNLQQQGSGMLQPSAVL